MKKCYQCQQTKPFSEFHKNNTRGDGYQNRCKSCVSEHMRGYYKRNSDAIKAKVSNHYHSTNEWIRSLKEGVPCMDCGGVFPTYVMDFDHRPGEVKLFGIARAALKHKTREAILAEIAKCDLVCANCHRMRTHGERKAKV